MDAVGWAIEAGVVAMAIAVGVVAIVRLRREGRPVLAGLGLGWFRAAPIDIAAGLVIGAVAMLAVGAVELSLGEVVTRRGGSAAHLPWQGLNMLIHALLEETVMRGLLLTGLAMLFGGRWMPAVILGGLIFGLSHAGNPNATPLSVLGNSLGGLIYGFAFVRSGAIWLPLGMHFAWNFVQGPILGFPVSGQEAQGLMQMIDYGPALMTGGPYGPEAGLIGFAARLVAAAGIIVYVTSGALGRLGRGSPK
jgi:membrane protease YdiL (CAAX protease family)